VSVCACVLPVVYTGSVCDTTAKLTCVPGTTERRAAVRETGWRLKLHDFLTNWKVEISLTFLLVLDIIFVIVAINLEIA
jgi:hypothetical protein